MNKRIVKIFGLVLTVATVLALGVGFIPGAAPKAQAAVGTLRFDNVPLPQYTNTAAGFAGDGKYVLLSANASSWSDLGPIAVSADGATIFATANVSAGGGDSGNVTDLLKSTDGGYTWTLSTAYKGTADTASIVAVKISPNYATDQTLWVATCLNVWESVDGGTTFSMVTPTGFPATVGEVITSIDIAIDRTGRTSELVGTSNGSGGNVYARVPATTGLGWINQNLGATVGANRQVLAVGFSSKFASDEGIFAVSKNTVANDKNGTFINSAFGFTKYGGGWNAAVGEGSFLTTTGNNITSTASAVIGFPSDFDINSLSTNIGFVGLNSGAAGQGMPTEQGDMFKVVFQPTRSSTVDLVVRGQVAPLQLSTTDIISMDVVGPAGAAKIVVGTNLWNSGLANYYWSTYYSTDSGATWLTAREKSATGGSLGNSVNPQPGVMARVAISRANNNMVYVATKGLETSAFSRSSDGGKSFNQISLISYGNTSTFYALTNMAVDPGYATSQTIRMVTNAGNAISAASWQPFGRGAVWVTYNGGTNWERMWSYANPSVVDRIDRISRTADNTTYVYDRQHNTIYRSTDDGASFPRTLTGPVAPSAGTGGWGFVAASFVDATTIWLLYKGQSNLWYTTNLGTPWVQMDTNRVITTGVSTTEGPNPVIARSGSNILIAGKTGTVSTIWLSQDGGNIFNQVGTTFNAGAVMPAPFAAGQLFDRNFATNHFIYVSNDGVGGGTFRTTVNLANPLASTWRQTDTNLNSGGPNNSQFTNIGPNFHFAPDNFYAFDTSNVSATSGGLWRSVNPDADIDSIYPPRFDTVAINLPASVNFTYIGFALNPTTLFVRQLGFITAAPSVIPVSTGNIYTVAYYNQLFGMVDTLGSGPTLTAPAAGATGIGTRYSTTDLTMTVVTTWTPIPGALTYEIQLANDAAFSAVTLDQVSTGATFTVTGIIPNTTKYWRVRVTQPFLSPWSTSRSFTTSTTELLETVVELKAPTLGATGVPLRPAFAWSAVIGSIGYDWEVAKDPAFTIPVERAGGTLAATNSFVLTHDLEYSTTYYWRVRAQTVIKPPTYTAWANGIFTTMNAPAAPAPPAVVTVPAPPQVIQVPAPAAIPSYLLWAIVVIGAILVIAVIVLIVRTRRVP